MQYDDNNIFAKILRGEIKNELICENKHCIAFNDINPLKKIHALVIPKGKYKNYSQFIKNASDEERLNLQDCILKVVEILNLNEQGYRLIANQGSNAGQEVDHLHFHILGGEILGAIVQK